MLERWVFWYLFDILKGFQVVIVSSFNKDIPECQVPCKFFEQFRLLFLAISKQIDEFNLGIQYIFDQCMELNLHV